MPLLSTAKTTRTRRLVTRVAIAGALAVVPLSAVAVPAFAATDNSNPTATVIDLNIPGQGDQRRPDQGGPGDQRDQGGPRDDHGHRGPDTPPAPAPQLLPPTGSFG
jgi:hypothetical protein